MIELGWTRDEVLDQIDIPFLEDLKGAWERFPPLRHMFGAAHGIKPKAKPSSDYSSLISMFPSGALR